MSVHHTFVLKSEAEYIGGEPHETELTIVLAKSSLNEADLLNGNIEFDILIANLSIETMLDVLPRDAHDKNTNLIQERLIEFISMMHRSGRCRRELI